MVGIKSLKPLSHLGTFASALENYGRKFININILARAQGRAYLLDHELLVCSISKNAKSIGPVPDWLSPAPMGLLQKIRYLFPEIISNEEYKEFEVGYSYDEADDDPQAEKLLSLLGTKNIHCRPGIWFQYQFQYHGKPSGVGSRIDRSWIVRRILGNVISRLG